MITLALIAVASATEPTETASLDRLLGATPTVEAVLAGPQLPEELETTTAEVETSVAAPVTAEAVTSEITAPPAVSETATAPAAVTEPAGTPINWDEEGTSAVLDSNSQGTSSANSMPLVMIPVSLGLCGLAIFFRRRVFSQLPSSPTEVPMNVVARKATGNQSAMFLVDVADLEGGTRRLLIGSSPAGNNLIADLSPSTSIFPEPVFESEESASNEPFFASKPRSETREERPALRAVESRSEAAKDLLDFGPKRALIDELISSSEKSSFRPRSVKKAYADNASVNPDPNSEEKRRAAQAVLDEVLAERRTGHRGTKVRVTA